jgi:phenylpropionate dioxygenase-like ring-hydroxylating dioxygenase large terminal subunit
MRLPLLITRDRSGALRVFHNVCSHRGMKLVAEPTEVQGLITCRYHCWSYATTGELKATPHIGGVNQHICEGFAAAEHGLKEVRSAVFMGVLFINLSGDAADFDQHIAPLRQRAASDTYSACRASIHAAWRVVFGEDVFAVEGMQAGRASPGYGGGVFSPVMDAPTHHFHGWVAAKLAEQTPQ